MKYQLNKLKLVGLLLIFNLLQFSALAQNKTYTLSGTIKDGKTGEALIGANIFVKGTTKGASSNTYGFYSITLPADTYSIAVRYIGYQEITSKIKLDQNQKLNLSLFPASITTKELVITGDAKKNTESTEMSRVKLDIEKIKALPAFLGEVDLIKTIQLLPGVASAGEGNTGLYVRGGGPDQNLILVDDAIVYNAAHLFGFFSIFNGDAVKNVELIKGGMPAQYGGRLASVLDINLKEGNDQELKVDGGIGLIASRLTIQGPIKKDKSSFIVSGRRTYIDVLSKPFIPSTSNAAGSGYYFYDMNAKINYKFGDKDQVYLSGYYGRDVFSFVNKRLGINFTIPWGNATATLRWNHLFSEKLFATTTASFSDYNFQFNTKFDELSAQFYSGIRDYNLKTSFSYFPSILHSIKFGATFTRHTFSPSIATVQQGDTKFDTGGKDKIYAHESAVYLSDDFEATDWLKINAGLRFSHFAQIGPFKRFLKDAQGNTTGVREYGDFETVAAYSGLEPRISARIKTGANQSVKAAYTLNYQYLQLASISPLSLPTDIWIPVSDLIKPQIGTQYTAGYFRNFKDDLWETSIEVYYKDMKNLIEYKEGAQPDDNVNDNVDNNLIQGSGFAYGVEFFVKKAYGKFNGWVGYTISKTMRRFDGIDNGALFPSKFDRRHDLSVALIYDRSKKWQFGAVFIYATGNAITLPVGRYFNFENLNTVDIYGKRNSFRMAAYHRLDLSATYKLKSSKMVKDKLTGEMIEKNKRINSSWTFSVYNAYSRKNPYFLYNAIDGQLPNTSIQLKQVSLFPVLPSVTWNFSF